MNQRVFIGLGSNLSGPLGSPESYIEMAIARLAVGPGLSSLRRSRLYQSKAWGETDQADFVNAVVEAESQLDAEALLDLLLDIENDLGRVRVEKWGPRLIDLDLLSFDGLRMASGKLTLPHPHMHQRAFVLAPLLELDPEHEIPGHGPARDCLANLPKDQAIRPL